MSLPDFFSKNYVYVFLMASMFAMLIPHSLLAQQYSYVHYDTKDGLAGSTVHGIAQDKDGFIWFATETGLSRFDGTHFKNFTRADGLPSNEVFGVFVDSKNRIWLTSFKNAICYYWKGKIHNQQNDSVLKKISLTSIISSVAENPQGEILIGCHPQNEFYIIKTNSEIVKLSNAYFDIIHGVSSFNTKIVLLPQAVRKKTNVDSCRYSPPYRDTKLSLIERSFLFTKGDSVIYFPTNKQASYSFLLPQQTRYAGYLDDNTIIALGIYSTGVRAYNLSKGQFIATYLPEYTVNIAFKDMEGCLWFSTKEAGVFKLSNPSFKNNSFYDKKTPLAVISIHKVNNDIYAGTSNSEYWKLKPVQTDNGRNHWHQPVKEKNDISLLSKRPYGQLIKYSSAHFFNFDFKMRAIKSLFVFNDTILISTAHDAALYLLPSMRRIRELHLGRTTTAYKKDDSYYIGTLNGLYIIDKTGKEVFLGDKFPLLRNRISSFAESRDGTLWIATYEAGIIGYKDGQVVANITQLNGNLSSDICRCIFIVGNTLWVGTEKGLNKVDITHGHYKTIEKYNANDGLGTDVINCIYIEGNMVYIGTPAGLTYFDQTKVIKHSICDIRLTGITVSDKPIDPEKDSIVLAHQDNNIRFEFAGISFLSSGDITYQYRLLGLSNEWQTIKEKILNYPSLPSGKYTLELKAINKFNDSSKTLRYHFEIEKTLWETYWFKGILILLIIGLIWLILQMRVRYIREIDREKHSINQKIAGLEQMALRAQMNPHFIFNCLNSIQHYIIKQDIKGANFYLSQFANLVRKTLENSSKIFVPFSEEITYLTNYIELEKLQLDDGFEYSIKADFENKDIIMIPNMVIQPYIENAFKHGVSQLKSGGNISLTFNLYVDENILECIVEDNGKGIAHMREMQQKENNMQHISKAMAITANRIEILNQLYPDTKSIVVVINDVIKEGQICGTRVTLRFPLNNSLN